MPSLVQQRSRGFAICIINCYKFLTEQIPEMAMSKQMLRCGMNIGTNASESKNAQAKIY